MASPFARLTTLAIFGAMMGAAPAHAQDTTPPLGSESGGTTPILTEDAPKSDLPTAEDLFERHIAAAGGHDKIYAQKNRRIIGVFEGPPFKFPARLTTWLEAPDKLRSHIAEPAGRSIDIGYDGKTAWRQMEDGPVVILDESAAANLRDAADFYGQANYKNRYMSIKTIGVGQLLGRSVYIVRAVWPSGVAEQVIFDRDSGYYVGVQYSIPTKEGSEVQILTVVDAYEDFGGAKYPTKITQMTPEGKVLAKYEYRNVRVDVDDGFDDYSPPADAVKKTDASGG
ncbi:MAG: hypothetical protein R3B57_11615 [Phycisphaerales bacterium]